MGLGCGAAGDGIRGHSGNRMAVGQQRSAGAVVTGVDDHPGSVATRPRRRGDHPRRLPRISFGSRR